MSKALRSLIRGLALRKQRLRQGLFVAEGPKLVAELLPAFTLRRLVALAPWLAQSQGLLPQGVQAEAVSPEELQALSLMPSPQSVIALFQLPGEDPTSLAQAASQDLTLALDGVQDPGNLGTIIRLADWFGIRHIYCSRTSADAFSPKAVQATMGALARVRVHYADLPSQLSRFAGNVYATFPSAASVYTQSLSPCGVIALGSEGSGLSPEVQALATHRISIPPYPASSRTGESLNVAMAAAIICAEFRRQA